ncbi:MAG TPA: hypothetical protein VJQ61_06560 [Sinomonas sp.]|nr:hypothetical protein [Sinomonas sp.]
MPAVGALEAPLGAALPDGLALAVVLADDDGAWVALEPPACGAAAEQPATRTTARAAVAAGRILLAVIRTSFLWFPVGTRVSLPTYATHDDGQRLPRASGRVGRLREEDSGG